MSCGSTNFNEMKTRLQVTIEVGSTVSTDYMPYWTRVRSVWPSNVLVEAVWKMNGAPGEQRGYGNDR